MKDLPIVLINAIKNRKQKDNKISKLTTTAKIFSLIISVYVKTLERNKFN